MGLRSKWDSMEQKTRQEVLRTSFVTFFILIAVFFIYSFSSNLFAKSFHSEMFRFFVFMAILFVVPLVLSEIKKSLRWLVFSYLLIGIPLVLFFMFSSTLVDTMPLTYIFYAFVIFPGVFLSYFVFRFFEKREIRGKIIMLILLAAVLILRITNLI